MKREKLKPVIGRSETPTGFLELWSVESASLTPAREPSPLERGIMEGENPVRDPDSISPLGVDGCCGAKAFHLSVSRVV